MTASTIVARTNVKNKPYDDQKVRHALQLGVDNAVVLQLGYGNAGEPAENHHVCQIHPEYVALPKIARDPAKAKALMAEAGQADFEHDLITVDEDWHKNTGDAIAAQLRDAGIKVKRTVLPGSTFWNDWTKYPFSMTNWNMRPLGIQVCRIAYRTGEAWNESRLLQPGPRRQDRRGAGDRRRREAQGRDGRHREDRCRIRASSSSLTGASSTITRRRR